MVFWKLCEVLSYLNCHRKFNMDPRNMRFFIYNFRNLTWEIWQHFVFIFSCLFPVFLTFWSLPSHLSVFQILSSPYDNQQAYSIFSCQLLKFICHVPRGLIMCLNVELLSSWPGTVTLHNYNYFHVNNCFDCHKVIIYSV